MRSAVPACRGSPGGRVCRASAQRRRAHCHIPRGCSPLPGRGANGRATGALRAGRVSLALLACAVVAWAGLPSALGDLPPSKRVTLSETRLKAFSQRATADALWPLLKPMLIPRVVGTATHAAVRNHIVGHFEKLGEWQVSLDEFETNTPLGPKTFANVVATLNPGASRRLVLAAHYDSKYFPNGGFVGATDSAVPCAMMLYVAQHFDAELKGHARRTRQDPHATTLQLIFFDGEEAFVDWTDTDSIYGSRHLAEKMSKSLVPGVNVTELAAIEALVLLDLIGAGGGHYYSGYASTNAFHDHLFSVGELLLRVQMARLGSRGEVFCSGAHRPANCEYSPNHAMPTSAGTPTERRLRGTGRLQNGNRAYFRPSASGIAGGEVADDHLPFLRRGVPVVHVIQRPFPPTWHTLADNERGLERDHVVDMAAIVSLFVAEHLGLR